MVDISLSKKRVSTIGIYKQELKDGLNCDCGNPNMGFTCICNWIKKNLGRITYSCEYCGIYEASKTTL